ncbi:MAG: ankyrin repeat domain-containing protein [Acidobacteriota bacterium]|nr:ankyrin repeat domain-containing protein [Acidobacteriota bacterium]
MPVKELALNTSLADLRYEAEDLLESHAAAQDRGTAQKIREFHPHFRQKTDAEVFGSPISLSDAELAIARGHGFSDWLELKAHLEKPSGAADLQLPYEKRIEDADFVRALELLDAGDAIGLDRHLREHPALVHQRVVFEGRNYFRNPTLLEFVAGNPVRGDALPSNIVQIAKIILDAGTKQDASALNETLGLVCSGRVPRECGVQLPLIDLLCDYEADPNYAISAALVHGEFDAVNALIRRGAEVNLAVAAALGRIEDAYRLLRSASSEERQSALALSAQFGHEAILWLLLEDGQDPDQYNPVGFHSHSTPLHQAAFAGHAKIVQGLVESGARLDMKDTLWNGTPIEWARYAGRTDIEDYLSGQQGR